MITITRDGQFVLVIQSTATHWVKRRADSRRRDGTVDESMVAAARRRTQPRRMAGYGGGSEWRLLTTFSPNPATHTQPHLLLPCNRRQKLSEQQHLDPTERDRVH